MGEDWRVISDEESERDLVITSALNLPKVATKITN